MAFGGPKTSPTSLSISGFCGRQIGDLNTSGYIPGRSLPNVPEGDGDYKGLIYRKIPALDFIKSHPCPLIGLHSSDLQPDDVAGCAGSNYGKGCEKSHKPFKHRHPPYAFILWWPFVFTGWGWFVLATRIAFVGFGVPLWCVGRNGRWLLTGLLCIVLGSLFFVHGLDLNRTRV
jgi:hypothetical protein